MKPFWRMLIPICLALVTVQAAQAIVAYEQPPDPAGGVLLSSWYPPDGTDYDMYVYDSFQVPVAQPITEVRWRGGYQYTGYGLVTDFWITFYESTAGGSQPLCGLPGDEEPCLAMYHVGGTAGQTPAGTFGGIQMYDYHYALTQPFQAAAGVKYWIRIEGEVAGLPFWGIAIGTGGNNQHFRYSAGSNQFSFGQRDASFSLHTTGGNTYQIVTSVQPAGSGTTTGDGSYPPGSQATVDATANAGWGFVNWTENGVPVSDLAHYTFTASANRALVANFDLGPGVVLFDFENAPIHTSLPIELTVDGLTASFTATGQGFSVQWANTMGFTPAGFAGKCLYPNSVFPADLLVAFSQPLLGFSILYSPQELGCDDSATMRVTAYMNDLFVGTATTTAFPPGTWPTGTLAIHTAQPFNNVVVHYDAPPPTCQDWGPIFMADNMLVTLAVPQDVPQDEGVAAARARDLAIAPNPATQDATIRFSLDRSEFASLSIHDAQGRLVRSVARSAYGAGTHVVRWDGLDDAGRPVADGIYFCSLRTGNEVRTTRLIVAGTR